MITAYTRTDRTVTAIKLTVGEPIPDDTVWVDLIHPTEEERLFVLSSLHIDLPDEAEMEEIEASSRLYVEGQTIFLTTAVITRGDSPTPEVGDLTFAVTGSHLVTTRYCEPRALDLFAFRLRKHPEYLQSSYDAFLEMIDAITDRLADLLQSASWKLDELAQQTFTRNQTTAKGARKQAAMTDVLSGIGQAGELTHKIRDSLMGLQRLLAFVGVQLLSRFTAEQAGRLKTVNRDVQSLMDTANTVTYETGFLLDATLGFINIEQNNIIKIFSIASVIFLPPTLVGTVYGMNFHFMPELDAPWGYPIAIGGMVLSAIIPILYFRRRGWL